MTAPLIKKLGIIAGDGRLPFLVIEHCQQNNITPYIIGIKGHADKALFDINLTAMTARIAATGQTVRWLKAHGIKDVVFIGGIKRPRFFSMIPDLTTLWFIITRGLWARGDNALLTAARRFLEKRGVKLWGVHHFLPELLTPSGVLATKTIRGHENDIKLGISAALDLGRQDIGQAVIVKNAAVLAREDKNGTAYLIKTHGQEGALLVKMCKPNQDKDLDLPTIGLNTIKDCAAQNMAGIVIHAQNSLFLDRAECLKLADQSDLFVYGASHD